MATICKWFVIVFHSLLLRLYIASYSHLFSNLYLSVRSLKLLLTAIPQASDVPSDWLSLLVSTLSATGGFDNVDRVVEATGSTGASPPPSCPRCAISAQGGADWIPLVIWTFFRYGLCRDGTTSMATSVGGCFPVQTSYPGLDLISSDGICRDGAQALLPEPVGHGEAHEIVRLIWALALERLVAGVVPPLPIIISSTDLT